MSYDFNVDEVFEMACRIERNGANFYRQAARGVSESSIHQLMLNCVGNSTALGIRIDRAHNETICHRG